MSKPGGAAGAIAVVPGIGTSHAAAAGRQRALQQRADADISSMVDNFSNMIKAAKVNDPVRNSQEEFQMEVHAARVVHSAESLLRLVSELKQSAVFADFASLNASVAERTARFEEQTEEAEASLGRLGEQAVVALRELEAHYYASPFRDPADRLKPEP